MMSRQQYVSETLMAILERAIDKHRAALAQRASFADVCFVSIKSRIPELRLTAWISRDSAHELMSEIKLGIALDGILPGEACLEVHEPTRTIRRGWSFNELEIEVKNV